MRKTSLYPYHNKLGAKIVDFAGYQMPISYSGGINSECNSVRTNVGIFDVSHMGQILIQGNNSFDLVQRLTTNDVSKINIGQCQYTAMCNKDGGIIDDLILYRLESGFLLVVNASNIEKDYNWILGNSMGNVDISNLSNEISLIALQGPNSREIISQFNKPQSNISFFTTWNINTILQNTSIGLNSFY